MAGCLPKKDLSKLSIGMNKSEVVAQLGKPKSVSVKGGVEYFHYESEASPYDGIVGGYFQYVRFIDGEVESFGKWGDFDSTNSPIKVQVEKKADIKIESNLDEGRDIYTELKKLKELETEGIITKEEFEREKQKLLDQN